MSKANTPYVVTTETWHHSSGSARLVIKVHGNQRDVGRITKQLHAAITNAMPRKETRHG